MCQLSYYLYFKFEVKEKCIESNMTSLNGIASFVGLSKFQRDPSKGNAYTFPKQDNSYTFLKTCWFNIM